MRLNEHKKKDIFLVLLVTYTYTIIEKSYNASFDSKVTFFNDTLLCITRDYGFCKYSDMENRENDMTAEVLLMYLCKKHRDKVANR